MAKLAEITPGTRVRGIVGDSPVTIKAVEWHGDSILNVIYKTDQGVLGDQPLFDTDEDKYIIEKSSAWRSMPTPMTCDSCPKRIA